MRLVGVAVVALALNAVPVNAQGFNPFGDMHTTRASQEAARRYVSPPASSGSFFGGPAFSPAPQRASRPVVQGPPLLEGGPRPSISPASPKTVSFPNNFGAGNVVIDTAGRQLFYVISSSQAYRYPISVGREGFTWRGVERVSRKASWPDWRPPAEMRERDPRLPELMTGGINNPLGAMAIYLGSSLYRIHGTNDARTIGQAASSGCFRMTNAHVLDLAGRVSVGAKVHVLDRLPANVARGVGPASG